jgi:LAS superfamily LD-carboxypeptidase LdcB
MNFSTEMQKATHSLLETIQNLRRGGKAVRIITLTELYDLCSTSSERDVINTIVALNPAIIDIPIPDDLKKIEQQFYTIGQEDFLIWNIFLSQEAHQAYQSMRNDCLEETGLRPIISSGYRSPAYQIITFLQSLQNEKWDYAQTITKVEIPGNSEHNFYTYHALDIFCSHTEGKASHTFSVLKEFQHTPVYTWMIREAYSYGFTLSYPEHNTSGKIFEPWHWKFNK